MKRRLLHIVTKLDLGGAQKHVLDLMRHADHARYEVYFFSAREGILWDEARLIPGWHAYSSGFLERSIRSGIFWRWGR
jgi:hypothetical protein